MRPAAKEPIRYRAMALYILLGCSPPAAALAQDWIRLVGGPSYELPAGRPDTVTIPIPIQLTGVAPESVHIELRDLMFNNRHEIGYFLAFSCARAAVSCLRLGRLGPSVGLSVMIPFDPKLGGGQGSYTLSLEATARGKDPVTLQFQMADPAARLRAVPKLKIERVWPSIGGNRDSVRLHLEEVMGAAIPDLETRLQDFADDVLNEGHIALGAYRTQLPGLDTITVPILLKGVWPLGTNAGSIEVRSRQLTEPFKVDVEVRQRYTSLFIFLIGAVGIFLGYLIRVVLARRVEEEDARVKASDLLWRLQADLALKQDSKYRLSIGAIIRVLKPEIQRRIPWFTSTEDEVTSLQQAMDTAEKDWEAARRSLEENRAVIRSDLASLSPIATTAWSLPEQMRVVQEAVRSGIATGMAQLDAFDATAAGDTWRTSLSECRRALAEALREWRQRVALAVESIRARPELLLETTVAEHIFAAAEEVTTLLDKVNAPGPNAGAVDLSTVFAGVHEVRNNIEELRGQLRVWLSVATREVVLALRRSGFVNSATLAPIEIAAAALDKRLQSAESPETLLELLQADSFASLGQATSEAITTALEKVTDEDRATIAPFAKAHRYVEAARRIADAEAKAPASKEGTKLGDDGIVRTAREGAPYTLASWAPSAHPALGGVFGNFLRQDLQHPAAGPIRVRSLGTLFSARLARTLLIGLLILLSGYALFKPGFVGTFDDLAKVFFWGFSLDITLDTVTRIMPKSST